ncbi:MAG: Probable 3-phenylpropionic acid transporter, partial [uncultured Acetobacteraceae bacterium]
DPPRTFRLAVRRAVRGHRRHDAVPSGGAPIEGALGGAGFGRARRRLGGTAAGGARHRPRRRPPGRPARRAGAGGARGGLHRFRLRLGAGRRPVRLRRAAGGGAAAQPVPGAGGAALGRALARRLPPPEPRLRAGALGWVGGLHRGRRRGGTGGGSRRVGRSGVALRRRAFAGGAGGARPAGRGGGGEPGRPGRLRGAVPGARLPVAAAAFGADPGQPRAVLRLLDHPLDGGGAVAGRHRPALGRGRGGGGAAVPVGRRIGGAAGAGGLGGAGGRRRRGALGRDRGNHVAPGAGGGAGAALDHLRRAAPGGDACAGDAAARAGRDGADAALLPGHGLGDGRADAAFRAALRAVRRRRLLGDGGAVRGGAARGAGGAAGGPGAAAL